MQLDLKTVYFLMTLALLIQAGVMLYLYREHRNYQGIGWWALGSVGLAIGFVISQFLEDPVLFSVTLFGSRALFVGASFLLLCRNLSVFWQIDQPSLFIFVMAGVSRPVRILNARAGGCLVSHDCFFRRYCAD